MFDEAKIQDGFSRIEACLQEMIQQSEGDAIAQLKILRFLEHWHQAIREDSFQSSLPVDRHSFYALVREMESEGGWPYIPRMQLRALLFHGEQSSATTEWEAEP